jgi:hypothetical protein
MEEETIKAKVHKWASKTTFHAIPSIAASESIIRKVLWFICLLVSAGLLFINNCISFLSN